MLFNRFVKDYLQFIGKRLMSSIYDTKGTLWIKVRG